MDADRSALPLARFRVLDLTRARSGPTCARQLADWGADVIKVDAPIEVAVEYGDSRHGPDFQNLHRNKRSIALDLKRPDGVASLKRLVEGADVLIENYRPGVKGRLGIDYEALRPVNPGLVYGSVSGFGQDGPYAERPGFDQIAQGMGGLMSITGLPGQGPVRVGVPIADLSAGLYLAIGILAALLERERSGQGQWVHTSLLQAQIAMLDFQAARWTIAGEVPPQAGNNHPTSIPTGVFATADGHINIAAAGDHIYARFCKALGAPELQSDPRYATSAARQENRDELNEAIGRYTVLQPSAHWVELMNEGGVPCGPIYSIDQVFADPQVRHLQMQRRVAHAALGELSLIDQPVNLSRTPSAIRRPAPDLGEHTGEILAELESPRAAKPSSGTSGTGRALAGLTVLDLTRVRAGPTCVRQLADWGANVIKLELPPAAGEVGLGGPRHGPDFQNLHRNKRSMTLNLKSPEGLALFSRLVADADVIVENYRPDVKNRLGIDYAAMREVNPRIVYGSISGFGQDGPYLPRPGVDQIAQGMGGLMSITGLPGSGPLRVGVPIADLGAGMFCAFGILVALLEREVSGEGQWVHTSLLESQIAMLDFQAARWTIKGEVAGQAGNNHPMFIPTGVFETSDGHMNLAPSGDAMYRRFCETLGAPELLTDPRFSTAKARSENRDAMNAAIDAYTRRGTSESWIERMNAAGVPCGPIYTMDQMFADPQVRHLGVARPVRHALLGEVPVVDQAVTMSRTPCVLERATPECGEHTDEILAEHGLGPAEIAALRAAGAI